MVARDRPVEAVVELFSLYACFQSVSKTVRVGSRSELFKEGIVAKAPSMKAANRT